VQALGGRSSDRQLRKAPLALAFFELPQDASVASFSVMQVVDPAVAMYRITDLTACAGLSGIPRSWVVELNLEVFAGRHGDGLSDDAILDAVVGELAAVGLGADGLRPLALQRVPGGFTAPDIEALAAWSDERAFIDRAAPELTLMAASSGFMVTSLSDQVVQGLKFAASLGATVDAA
jgi:hypothetical protein